MSDTKATMPIIYAPSHTNWNRLQAGQVPENAFFDGAIFDDDFAYIGRVYEGRCAYIGTVIPGKGICCYMNKEEKVKTSKTFEVLCCNSIDGLYFDSVNLEHRHLFPGGRDEEEVTYVGRKRGGNRTFFGWIKKSTNSIFIPGRLPVGLQEAYFSETLDHSFEALFFKRV